MIEPYSLKYCIPYIIVFICFLYLSCSKYGNKSQFICSVIFIFFFGFRGFVGWDWQNYFVLFSQLSTIAELDNLFVFTGEEIIEPGFTLYMTFIKSLVNDWNFFLFFSVVIDWLGLHLFFRRYSVNYAFSFLIFSCVCIGTELDLLRNIKAIILFLYAIRFIENRRIISYVIIILIAVMFHYSALVFIPLYFLGAHPFSRKTCAVLLIVSCFVYLLQIPLASKLLPVISDLFGGAIGTKLDNYNNIGSARGLTLGFLIRVIVALCVLWRYNECTRYKFMPFFISIYFVATFVALAFSDINVVAQRVETLLNPILCVIYPVLLVSFRIQSNRFLISIFIYVYLLLILIRSSMVAMYQYENVLFGAMSYEQRLSQFSTAADIIIEKNGQ